MSAIFSIGVFFAFFMGVLLFSKKGRTIPDIILGIWMCVIGAHLLAYHLYYLGYWEVYPHLFGTTAMFPLLDAPLLFLYTSYSLNGHQKFRSSDYLHFTPTLLSYIHLCHIYFFYSVEMKIDLDNGVIDDSLFISVLLSFLVLSSFIYTIIS